MFNIEKFVPFQTTVLALLMIKLFKAIDFSPISYPAQSSSIPVHKVAYFWLQLFSNLSPQMKSIGKWIYTFLSLAFMNFNFFKKILKFIIFYKL